MQRDQCCRKSLWDQLLPPNCTYLHTYGCKITGEYGQDLSPELIIAATVKCWKCSSMPAAWSSSSYGSIQASDSCQHYRGTFDAAEWCLQRCQRRLASLSLDSAFDRAEVNST